MGMLVHQSRSLSVGRPSRRWRHAVSPFLISMENLPPESLQKMQDACRVVEKVRIEDPLQGPFRNGVSTGEGVFSVRLMI